MNILWVTVNSVNNLNYLSFKNKKEYKYNVKNESNYLKDEYYTICYQ